MKHLLPETIAQCALDNPDLPIEFIKELLIAKNQDLSLAAPFVFEGDPDITSSD